MPTTEPGQNFEIVWETWLDPVSAGPARDALVTMLDDAMARQESVEVAISAASCNDHIARQLVAAARKTASDANVSIHATAPDGDWDALIFHGGVE